MSMDNVKLRQYIELLGLPEACITAIASMYEKMDARIWVVENSRAMQKKDSNLIKATANLDRIVKKEGVSRWEELSQCIDFHSKMAARCWIPTKFWLVNDPGKKTPKRFGLCWGEKGDVSAELDQVKDIVKTLTLDNKVNPLARQLKKIKHYLSKEATRLEERAEFVGVIVCTQGVPTDESGNRGSGVVKDFVKSLASLSRLPVKICFRLCTDNDDVIDFYQTLDINEKLSCDVLDDFWGEASEVYLHNPWLTYGIGLHRLREAGIGTELMDELDEKALSLDEIHEFCIEFFVGSEDIPLSNPCQDFPGFIRDLDKILLKENLVWNPCKKRLCPWIDVDKLKRMFRRAYVTGNGMGKRVSYCRASPGTNKSSGRGGPTSSNRGAPPSMPNPLGRSKTENYAGARRETNPLDTQQPVMVPPKSQGPKDLAEAIQRWAYIPPDQKRLNPMEKLLVEVPSLFPHENDFVEDHEYCDKWKEFSEDAFLGETGDDLKDLLKRAARKAKFFLHPDKLPKDLTENQATLFRSIWDVIQESEAKTLAD